MAYLGRYQLGQFVPLQVLVQDQAGTPAEPTLRTPMARITALGSGQLVMTVSLHHLRRNRVGPVYVHQLRLASDYLPGRYGVLYQVPTGSFLGAGLALFEVVPQGDPAGPVIATTVVTQPAGDQVLAQVGGGQLVLGQKPRLS